VSIRLSVVEEPRDSIGVSSLVCGRNEEADSVHDNSSSSRIMRRLTTLFPSEFLEGHAEELGVVERDRDLQMPVLVWALVFGLAAGESRTLAGSDAATTRRLMRRSRLVASISG